MCTNRRSWSVNARVLSWCLIGALVATLYAADAQLTRDDLVAIAQANAEAITAVEMQFDVKQAYLEPPKHPVPLCSDLHCRFLFDMQKGRFLYRSVVKAPAYPKPDVIVTAYDGADRSEYIASTKSGTILANPPPDSVPTSDKTTVLAAAMVMPPKPGGFGLNDGSMVSLLKHQASEVQAAPERVEGQKVYVCTSGTPQRRLPVAWVSPDWGALPVKLLTYAQVSSGEFRVMSELRVLEARRFDDHKGRHVWLPIRFETVDRPRDGSVVKIQVTVEPESIRINPELTDTDFRVPFPVGTVVKDVASNAEFKQTDVLPASRAAWTAEAPE